jgi:hypothetical protein
MRDAAFKQLCRLSCGLCVRYAPPKAQAQVGAAGTMRSPGDAASGLVPDLCKAPGACSGIQQPWCLAPRLHSPELPLPLLLLPFRRRLMARRTCS